MDEWRKIYHNDSQFPIGDARRRGWSYAMADVVATLQLGLVQWIRGDVTLVLKPSKGALSRHDVALANWMRENAAGWGPRESAPKAPTDNPACSVPPQAVVCPEVLFMKRSELRKVWCEGRDD